MYGPKSGFKTYQIRHVSKSDLASTHCGPETSPNAPDYAHTTSHDCLAAHGQLGITNPAPQDTPRSPHGARAYHGHVSRTLAPAMVMAAAAAAATATTAAAEARVTAVARVTRTAAGEGGEGGGGEAKGQKGGGVDWSGGAAAVGCGEASEEEAHCNGAHTSAPR